MDLAASGITTITKYILLNRVPSKDDPFLPTIDFDRHSLVLRNKEITIYDMGGQTAFLDRFTGELAEFVFGEVKTFVFVIDSIDIKNISRAKYYFDLCLKKLAEYSPTARIFIFQHKIDLVPKKMRTEVRNTLEEYLLAGINPDTIKQNIVYYETSVFTHSMIPAVDAVMSWMLDGELHLYHQYLDSKKRDFQTRAEKLDKRLTHLGLTPEIGTESVVGEKDKHILKQAVQTFEDATISNLSDLDPKMLIKTGLAHRELGEHKKAVKYYQAAIRISKSSRVYFHLGYDLIKSKKYQEAITAFTQADVLRPNDPDTLYNWGVALDNQRRFEEAIEKYTQTDNLRPDDPKTLINWGVTLWKLERLEEAIDKITQANVLSPNDPDTQYNWGNTLNSLGCLEEAIEKYTQADSLRSNHPDTLINWGVALNSLGRLEEAIEKFTQADNLRPDDPLTVMNWGVALRNLGRLEEAIDKYKEANSRQPNYPLILVNYGIALEDSGRKNEAKKCFLNASNAAKYYIQCKGCSSRFRPNDPLTLANCGIALEDSGRKNEAKDYYLKASNAARTEGDSTGAAKYEKLYRSI